LIHVIRALVFDVGECIVNESREYGTWADWPGVPRHTFSAVFGAVIARGLDYSETFHVFRPGFDLDEERRLRAAACGNGVDAWRVVDCMIRMVRHGVDCGDPT
jgi:hypothetical protein